MSRSELQARIQTLPWFHELDFGDGIVTPGRGKIPYLQATADIYFGPSLAGKTVLDIGCYDGFYSFSALKKGASRVLATDYYMWSSDPRCKEAFLLARSQIAPDLEYKQIDIFDLNVESVGTFDVVLFSGVLYHLKNPFLALERVSLLANEQLIVETHLDALDQERPAAIFYPGAEQNNDASNWWGPNPACVLGMLEHCGFHKLKYKSHPLASDRGIFYAYKED